MGGWLQKILLPEKKPASREVVRRTASNKPLIQPVKSSQGPNGLPNATIIYGIGASLLFVAALTLLLEGRFFPAFLVLVLGGGLTGFALHLLKHQD